MRMQRIKPVDKKYGSLGGRGPMGRQVQFLAVRSDHGTWGWVRPEGDGVRMLAECRFDFEHPWRSPGCAHIKEAAENGAEKRDPLQRFRREDGTMVVRCS